MKLFAALLVALLLALGGNAAEAQTAVKVGHCASYLGSDDSTGTVLDQLAVRNVCSYPVAAYICAYPSFSTTACQLNPTTVNANSTTIPPVNVNILTSDKPVIVGYECPAGTTTVSGTLSSASAPPCQTMTSSSISAAALPNAFAARTNTSASVFATMIVNGGGTNCQIALAQPAPTGLGFSFQQTNPATNQPFGGINLPITIPGTNNTATFLLSFSSAIPQNITALPIVYSCNGPVVPVSQAGLSSVDVVFSSTPIPDIVAVAATTAGNNSVTATVGSTGAFAVSTDNTGGIGGTIVVKPDTGSAALPVTLTVCQTNPSTGACLATPASSVSPSIAQGATPTFSVFAKVNGTIANSPGTNRVFLRFLYNNVEVGATSVSIQS